jgi:hypothetical protein
VQPGWYPDPYSVGGVRWWDGHAWTEHARSAAELAAPKHAGPPATDLGHDLSTELRWGRLALITIWVVAALGIAANVLGATVLPHQIHTSLHHFHQEMNRLNANQSNQVEFSVSWQSGGLSDVLTLVVLLAQLPMMIWLWSAARVSRNFGVPARRSAFWGILAFFVPIVDFWFPYQVARDIFGFFDRRRSLAARWWTYWILQAVASGVIVIVGLFSVPVAVVLAVAASALPALVAWYARAMITQSSAMHREWVAPLLPEGAR